MNICTLKHTRTLNWQAKQLGLPNGVLVLEAREGFPAAKAGVKVYAACVLYIQIIHNCDRTRSAESKRRGIFMNTWAGWCCEDWVHNMCVCISCDSHSLLASLYMTSNSYTYTHINSLMHSYIHTWNRTRMHTYTHNTYIHTRKHDNSHGHSNYSRTRIQTYLTYLGWYNFCVNMVCWSSFAMRRSLLYTLS